MRMTVITIDVPDDDIVNLVKAREKHAEAVFDWELYTGDDQDIRARLIAAAERAGLERDQREMVIANLVLEECLKSVEGLLANARGVLLD
jgi:hypothetical protein